MVSAVCTDGAYAMMGCNSGLRGLIKGDAPHITITHCMLHRHALMSKTLPSSLADVLKIVVETGNYVKGRPLNHRIFMQLCELIDSEFKVVLLYHSEVRWLSGKGDEWRFCIACRIIGVSERSQPSACKALQQP